MKSREVTYRYRMSCPRNAGPTVRIGESAAGPVTLVLHTYLQQELPSAACLIKTDRKKRGKG